MLASSPAPAIEFTLLSGVAGTLLACLLLVIGYQQYLHPPLLPELQKRCLGIALALLPIWYLKAGIHAGLEMHFLGLTAATLMIGWRLTFLIATANLVLLSFWQGSSVAQTVIEILLGIGLPILVSHQVLRLYRQHLPRHFFVYVFCCGFFAAALSMLVRHLALGGFYLIDGQYRAEAVLQDYLHLWPLMLFPEALLNGMAISLMATYKPQWLDSFQPEDLK
ncbi:energy-coupling factor ABC transporter permease [Motilimonas eburnea]|uniref:energy-coupling factor ABC transporter permease n=1 Tax=Motilimonas eburnea TaxID=1737488 RepID=UPI001E47C554|nr:energy-coupling factor ABC transporter permease [Motilimonas eburnea]MCE2573256.1 energy-coupling factor ABC transporter permease [Motilimonas eburnea]